MGESVSENDVAISLVGESVSENDIAVPLVGETVSGECECK